ncbi:Gibberellin 3-beta-dioxygenase 1 [Camellia lanceoleosa]|uniref:Gibberellin 3-beta-dioxygenase 1 n=1 Tax=Camellia lanceoleosa TaxID=1840588 RepID=A0ACC0FA66_9ERIC|nr:Gibberellin 3-beta-dioxygenase 1 [Camellia lanceoleosa]
MQWNSWAMHAELGVCSKSRTMVSTRAFSTVLNPRGRAFSLSHPAKAQSCSIAGGRFRYGVARISSFFPKLMWSEGFTIFGSPLEHACQLWPQDYSNFCDVIEEYEKEMKILARRLMWLMLGSLDISKEDVKWAGPKGDFKGANAAIQLNSYPACPEPDRAMGLAAHTDSTLLTILYQNNTSGLQVHRDGSGWVTVPPIPDTLVVNIGDLLHILSNGLYPSVLHRAMVNRTRHRLSVAYLYGPPPNVQISPLSKLVDLTHPPLYRPVTWTEYLGTKAKYFDKALSSVRLCVPLNGLVDVNDHNGVEVGWT